VGDSIAFQDEMRGENPEYREKIKVALLLNKPGGLRQNQVDNSGAGSDRDEFIS
jgi:hypothetical protein